MNTPNQDAADFALTVTHAKNGGYRDAYAGKPPNPPAWDTVPEWSNAYAEGYALGQQAARKIKRTINQQPLF